MFSARQAFAQIARIMNWPQQAKLLASDRNDNDAFGNSIAISADGNTVAVGAWLEDTAPFTSNGAVYIFTRSGTTWTQQAKLLASDRATDDQFGSSIAISADGNTVAVGAPNKSNSPLAFDGAAYIFTRSGTTWTQQAKLLASDRNNSDTFGSSVAISDNGNTVAVGAYGESTSPFTSNGAAYIFTRSGTTWTQQTKLLASDRASYDRFGRSVAISSAGDTVAVGAINKGVGGAAYVFTRSGTTWTQQAKLVTSDVDAGDDFGFSIAISSTGDTVAVGALDQSTAPLSNSGAAYIFTRSGTVWTEQAKLLASDRASNDYLGSSIAISADGDTVAVGAYGHDTSPFFNSGAAYIFTRSDTVWTLQARLLASDRASNDYLGSSIAISADGDTVAVGAVFEDTASLINNGAAYIFTRPT